MTTFNTTNNEHYYLVAKAVDSYIAQCFALANQAEADIGMEGFESAREYVDCACVSLFHDLVTGSEAFCEVAFKLLNSKRGRDALYYSVDIDELDANSEKTFCQLALMQARVNGDLWNSSLHKVLIAEYPRIVNGTSVFTKVPLV